MFYYTLGSPKNKPLFATRKSKTESEVLPAPFSHLSSSFGRILILLLAPVGSVLAPFWFTFRLKNRSKWSAVIWHQGSFATTAHQIRPGVPPDPQNGRPGRPQDPKISSQ